MKKKETPVDELRKFLQDRAIILDCGHRFSVHPLSNTLIVTSDGETYCHNCFY